MAMGGGGGGGMGAAIKAGQAVVTASLDMGPLKSGIAEARKMALKIGAGIGGIGAGIGGIGAAITAPIIAGFKSAVDEVTEFRKAADQLGSTTEIVSGLAFAAKKAGVDTDTFVTSARHMQKVLSEAAGGDKGAIDSLAKLGIKAQDLIDKPLDEQFAAIADGIKGLSNPADQAAAALDIMGRSGADLVPVLRKGSAGLADMRTEAENMGAIVSTEDAANAKLFTSAIGRAKLAVEQFWKAVGSSILPLAAQLKEYSDIFVQIVWAARRFVEENRAAIATIFAVGSAIIGIGTALIAVGSLLAAASVAVGGFLAALSAVGAVLAVVFSPVGLGIAALVVAGVLVAALVADFADLEQIGKVLGPVFRGLADTFASTWSGISDALAAGDLKLAFEIAVAGLDVVWKGFLVALEVGWGEFKGVFVDGWHAVAHELEKVWDDLTTTMAVMIAKVVAEFKDAIGDAAGAQKYRDAIPLLNLNNQTDKERKDFNFGIEQRARESARLADLTGAAAGLGMAVAALKDLEGKAAYNRGIAEFLKGEYDPEKAQRAAGAMQAIAGGTRGAFGGGNLAQQFMGGSGTPIDKIEKNTKRAADGIDEMKKKGAGLEAD